MSIIRKLLNILVIALIAVSLPARSGGPFDPDDGKYPPLIVKWDNTYYHSFGGGNNNDAFNGPQPPNFVLGSEINGNSSTDPICGKLPVDFAWNITSYTRQWGPQRTACVTYFNKVKDDLVSPCQYIEAFGVTVKGNNRTDRLNNYRDFNIIDGYEYPGSTKSNKDDDGSNFFGNDIVDRDNDGNLKNVQFRIKEEPNCKFYEEDDNGNLSCPACYGFRVPGSDNDPIDDNNNNSGDDIISQGCLPEMDVNPWKSIGVGQGSGAPDLNIGDFYGFTDENGNPVSGLINMVLPKCLTAPITPKTPFNTFEKDWETDLDPATTTTENDTQSNIDAIYGTEGKAGQRTNEWRGSCGRGMFFYKNNVTIDGTARKFRDSNLVTANPPKTTDDINTSEIWESRTGCYNPEERFVHLPPYVDFKTEKEALTINGVNPLDLGTDRIKFYEPGRGGRQVPTGSLRDGPPDEVEAGSGDSPFLVPNDRLLMEHPLCTTRVFSNTLQTGLLDGLATNLPDLAGLLQPYGNIDKYAYKTPNGVPISPSVIKNMMATGTDKKSGIESGALPMCLANDTYDDADDYCMEYLKFTDKGNLAPAELGQVGNVTNEVLEIERRRKGKYNAERYYFNYDTFCWEAKERPFILPPDPYERWMPLAVRSTTNPTKSGFGYSHSVYEERESFLGKNVKYINTDIRRPTFTPYAERHVYDYTELGEARSTPGDQEFLNLSLEEYGYGDTPHARTDYNIDPTNIYQLAVKPTPQELLMEEKRGRKYKLQQCLRMYIEQWAFEGDRGAILLSDLEAATGNKSNLASDVSMCQWVASYDTSKNYDKQRDKFKEIMTHFFGKAILGGGTADTKQGSSAAVLLGGKAPSIPIPGTTLDGILKSDNDFKRGMRPEYFDYMNFLTASILPAELEDNSLSNKVEVDGGEHYYDDVYNRLDIRDPKKTNENLPSPLSYPQKINFSKRDCETVVPPQFWRDTINPFYEEANNPHSGGGCHPVYDFRNITDIVTSLSLRNNAFDNSLTADFSQIIHDVIGKVTGGGQGNFHWLTTREDMPVLSLGTAIPTLPVFAVGVAPKNKIPTPYFVQSWEKFPTSNNTPAPLEGGNPNENFELRDVWMSRSGGETALNYHLIQSQNKTWRLSFPNSKLGLIVVDEKTLSSGREWIDHSFPARTCLHMEPLQASKLTRYWNYERDPNATDEDYWPAPGLDTPDPENLLYDSWKTWDDIRLTDLALYLKALSPYTASDAAFVTTNDTKNFGGFKVWKSQNKYYQWLPTAWSTGFGMGKTFWCEFEVPYFPYLIEDQEFEHAKKSPEAHFKINGQVGLQIGAGGGGVSFELQKKYKPRLEYYRVERIRDACGPFGVASTWVDDPNGYISDWLIGKSYTDSNGVIQGENLKLKSRCADWYDSYRRKTNDPKIIAWRLPRFDYEFLKAFLECTGPIKDPGETPPVCQENTAAKQNNKDACTCEIAKGAINLVISGLYAAGSGDGKPIECLVKNVGISELDKFKVCDLNPAPCTEEESKESGATDKCKDYWSEKCTSWRTLGAGGLLGGVTDLASCFSKWCDYDVSGGALNQFTYSNLTRSVDYCTRGDTEYAYDHTDKDSNNDLKKYSLIGFDNNTGYYGRDGNQNFHNSVDIPKFWLDPGGKNYSADDPSGFWCKCPEDQPNTTRCREDFCTCQQHTLLVGRNMLGLDALNDLPGGAGNGGGFLQEIDDLAKPVAICKWYGPYLRWLQCFYQARAKACPVVTREISDSINYDSVYDPFRGNKQNKIPNLPEATQKSVVFNVCPPNNPTGLPDPHFPGNSTPFQILDYLRWSKEEPNHLAKLPVWFESGGAGYKHQDFVFQSQARRWESPFMELAVPFPIDLITRSCNDLELDSQGNPTGNCNDDWKNVTTASDDPCTSPNDPTEECQQGESINNLKEVQNRGGLGYKQLKYDSTFTGVNEYTEASNNNLRSALLMKERNTIIRPTGNTLKNKNYVDLYSKYIEGLYAAHLGFRHSEKPEEPWSPTDKATSASTTTLSAGQNIHPRAQDAIVGPRGCDIGGWYEMMLYQARCIKWWKLNCICDYDKTFAIGNSETYVHKKAGATFNIAVPSFYNAKYKQKIAENKGLSYAVLDSSTRNLKGDLKGEDQRKESTLTSDVEKQDGQAVFADDSKEVPEVEIRNISIPLAYRGIASPEFAGGTGVATDNILYGLDEVIVGDILIWNESIDYTLSSGEKLDAGYPRHAAYVESVTRDAEGSAIAIKVSEMNWGKNIDSCGNTNRWGKVTSRTIVKPMCASNIDADQCPYKASVGERASLLNSLLPSGLDISPNAGTIDLFASCQNADWAVCVEKYWPQVMVYRPYTLAPVLDANDNLTSTEFNPDTNYFQADCPTHLTYPKVYNQIVYNTKVTELKDQNIGGLTLSSDIPDFDNVTRSEFFDTSTPDENDKVLQYDYAKIGDLIRSRYIEGHITRAQIEAGLWKLLIDPSNGSIPVDEFESVMLNALNGGALGRCDPPIEFRDNYKKVKEDYWTKNDND